MAGCQSAPIITRKVRVTFYGFNKLEESFNVCAFRIFSFLRLTIHARKHPQLGIIAAYEDTALSRPPRRSNIHEKAVRFVLFKRAERNVIPYAFRYDGTSFVFYFAIVRFGMRKFLTVD